ncbi:MAG TPA: hypothetical protein VD962_06855 [Rubricoccaceae bacterium]|nr:hypothetical protein [Rubricoccaceae bacterium]
MDRPFASASPEHVSTRAPSSLGLALLQLAAGDVALLEGYRAIAWSAYREAGFPFGMSEEGLERWWADQLDGASA